MATLSFETGVVEYSLNDKATVRFNPTDLNFAEKLFDCIDKLDAEQNSIEDKVKDIEGSALFSVVREIDARMRELIDGLLGENVCNDCFGDTNLYSLAGGFPIWANLFIAIIDEINDAFARENKETTPRMQKYTAKYAKKGRN